MTDGPGNTDRTDGARGRFATTRWTLVLAAGEGGGDDADRALAELCSLYWYPLYAYARRRGHGPEEASDLTQSFFAKLLEKRDLRAADPGRGRFRTFLLSSMKNFLAGEWRREHTLKRGGTHEILGLDFDSAEETFGLEPASGLDPEAAFQRRWALDLLDRAVADVRAQYERAGNVELFEALKGYLGAGDDALPYPELAVRLGKTEGSLRVAVTRLRARWRERIRERVAETVDGPERVEDEIRNLIASVAEPV